MKNIFTRQRILFGLLLVALIMAMEIPLHYGKWPAWPAFMGMIFFFLGERETCKILPILAGGLFGIACGYLIVPFKAALAAPLGGEFEAQLLFIAVFVLAIVFFKEVLPAILNDYAFMLFLVSALAYRGELAANPAGISGTAHLTLVFTWMCIELIGGGILIAGVVGITRLLERLDGESEPAGEA
jgi:hypothetical protein